MAATVDPAIPSQLAETAARSGVATGENAALPESRSRYQVIDDSFHRMKGGMVVVTNILACLILRPAAMATLDTDYPGANVSTSRKHLLNMSSYRRVVPAYGREHVE